MSSFTSWRAQEGETMAEKKERGRFSIKFNENDPSHAAVIELLEKQGPHSKAQFIANAILHYVHCTEMPDIHPVQAVDKVAIEEIVMEILRRQNAGAHGARTEDAEHKEPEDKPAPMEPMERTENSGTETVDASMMALIADTMSAFRSQ